MNPLPSSSIDVRRIGSVSYLNARPLICGIEDRVRLDVPTLLARDLRAGKLDAALVPVAEYLEHPRYQIVPGIAIGSRGPVLSVYLASRKPTAEAGTVALDPASKTSNLLLKVVFAEFLGLSPRYVAGADRESCDAQLLIGDPALLARERLLREGYHLLDLGEVWQNKTGLPFVYAFWAVGEGLDGLPYIEFLTRAKERGLQQLEQIVASENILPTDVARTYLTRHIRYDLGAKEMKGLLEFQRLCVRHGLIARASELKLAA